MSFFSELQRRNVFRVGAAYAVLAWLFIQIIDTVLPNFGAPAWVLQTLIFFVILGFFGAIILAWIFEITPEGVKTQKEADREGSGSAGNKLNTVIIVGLSMAVIFLLLKDSLVDPQAPEPEDQPMAAEPSPEPLQAEITATAELEKSLAVLPFADLSPEGDQEYFSDGLSEELLNKLAQVDDLRVTARTSSFFYKGRNEDMRTIGEELGVNYILEGSVRKAENNIRITAQLIQADNGFHLWSDTYDRELADIFDLQDEIAAEVTTALSVTLGAGEFDLPGMTRNVEAYEESLKAWYEIQKATPQSARAAIELIERAVQLDPDFLRAWFGMIEIYSVAEFVSPQDQVDEFINRREYATTLIREEANDPALTATLQINELMEERNLVEAERRTLQLIEVTGGTNSIFNLRYAGFLAGMGRDQDALPYYQAARRADPLNPAVSMGMHRTLLALNRVGEARVEIERGLNLELLSGAFEAVIQRGNWHAALQEGDLERAKQIWTEIGEPVAPNPFYYWLNDDYETGLQKIREGADNENTAPIWLGAMAQGAMVMGDAQLALDLRRRSEDIGTIWMPIAEEMRKLPDFKLFMEEMGIADYWRSTGNWADKCRPLPGNDDYECF